MADRAEPGLDFPVYSIKAVAHMAGVTEPTLRAWEKRYTILAPQRTASGHRRYTRRDILRVLWLKQQIDKGMAISQASALLQSQGDLDLLELNRLEDDRSSQTTARTPVTGRNSVRSVETLADELLQAFLGYDEQRADELLTEATSLYALETVCLQLIQPVMYEIGERWLRNEVTVATEHFASNICRLRVTAMIKAFAVNTQGPLIVTGCAPQEYHELGILITTFLMRRNGWQVIYLGQNVPAVDLEKDLDRLKPAMLCLSASRTETALTLAREIMPTIARVRQSRLPHLIFAYGGRAFVEQPALQDMMDDAIYCGDDALGSVARLARIFDNRKS